MSTKKKTRKLRLNKQSPSPCCYIVILYTQKQNVDTNIDIIRLFVEILSFTTIH